MIAPNLLWQYHHGWPFLELSSVDVKEKNVILSPLAFLVQQVLLLGPVAAPVWIAGLWAFGFKPKLAAYRALAIAWLTLVVMVTVLHGKAYYTTPIYPILFAGGAVWTESKMRRVATRTAYAVILVCASLFVAPLAIPILPVGTFLSYAKLLGSSPSSGAGERHKMGPLPQHFADMFGWREMAEKVAAVYNQLPPADRAKAVFFGNNYGEAAAIDVFGQPLGVPPAISGHNNYFLWGPRGHDGNVVIVLGGDHAELQREYQEVTVAEHMDNPFAMPYETDLPIYVLRGIKASLETIGQDAAVKESSQFAFDKPRHRAIASALPVQERFQMTGDKTIENALRGVARVIQRRAFADEETEPGRRHAVLLELCPLPIIGCRIPLDHRTVETSSGKRAATYLTGPQSI